MCGDAVVCGDPIRVPVLTRAVWVFQVGMPVREVQSDFESRGGTRSGAGNTDGIMELPGQPQPPPEPATIPVI